MVCPVSHSLELGKLPQMMSESGLQSCRAMEHIALTSSGCVHWLCSTYDQYSAAGRDVDVDAFYPACRLCTGQDHKAVIGRACLTCSSWLAGNGKAAAGGRNGKSISTRGMSVQLRDVHFGYTGELPC